MSCPLIVIVGPTACGKSALAMHLASKYGGEIIAADSRTVYRGMDIGTAKPTKQDQHDIKHHLIDVVNPDQKFSAADFKSRAEEAINEICSRGKLPIIVGGTGLYIDAVLFDYSFRLESDSEQRQALTKLTLKELQSKVQELGIDLNNSDFNNPHRLIRAIETSGMPTEKSALRDNTLVIGLQVDREKLNDRIKERAQKMFTDGLGEEVDNLLVAYPKDAPGLLDASYRSLISYREGSLSKEVAINEVIKSHINLAKRQMTWFKRNPDINWVARQEDADKLVTSFLERL